MEIFKTLIEDLLKDAFSSFDDLVNNSVEVLTGGGTLFNATSVWYKMRLLSNTLKPFCYIVISICLLIEMAQVASKVDIIKWEHGLKLAVKMALSKVMIDTAPTFLKACYNQASLWITGLSNEGVSTTLGTTMSAQISSLVSGIDGFWKPLGAFITLLIPCMAIKICGLLVEVMAFARMFELYCLLCISPLPCAFFPLGDGSGGGYSRITRKFLLNFIGVCLQGVMIIICIRLFGIMMASAVTGASLGTGDNTTQLSNLCYTMLLGGIVLVMSCVKSGQWAKSVLDA